MAGLDERRNTDTMTTIMECPFCFQEIRRQAGMTKHIQRMHGERANNFRYGSVRLFVREMYEREFGKYSRLKQL